MLHEQFVLTTASNATRSAASGILSCYWGEDIMVNRY